MPRSDPLAAWEQEQKVAKLDPAVEDKVQVFAEILNDINAAYVDPLDLDKITETGFNAMLQSLDPYTEFENPKATTQMRTLTTGNYGGVGLAISKLKTPKGDEEPYIYVVNAPAPATHRPLLAVNCRFTSMLICMFARITAQFQTFSPFFCIVSPNHATKGRTDRGRMIQRPALLS